MKTKWTEEAIIAELLVLKDQFPKTGFTQRLLKKLGRNDLGRAIDRTGYGLAYFQQKLGYDPSEKPKGYWNSIDNIIKEIEPHVQNNILPTLKVLKEKIGSRIADAIAGQGGIEVIAKKMGCKTQQKPKEYWCTWENIEELIKPHIKDNRFPTQTELVSIVKGSIGQAIAHFGGIHAVAERMGYKLHYTYKATDGHYLNSANELIFDEYLIANQIPHEVNGLITQGSRMRYDFKIGEVYVEIWGYESHRTNSRICKRYNAKRLKKEKVYKHLGLTCVSIEAGLFRKSPDEIKAHFDKIIEEHKLKDGINPDSATIIHNTMKGCYYWHEGKVKEELEAVINQIGHFPTQTELYEMDRGDLKDAVSRHGGQHHFAKLLGTECKRKEEGYWNDETIMKALKEEIEKLDTFPTFNQLENKKQFDLIRAINRNGGLPKFRNLLGFPELVKPHGYYTEEIILQELHKVKTQLGYMPGGKKIREVNKTLSSAIDRLKYSWKELRKKVE
jgi:hypothetical protein